MKLPHIQEQFKVRIVYKSGYTHDFWVTEFSVKRNFGSTEYEWVAVAQGPVQIGVDEIAATWTIGRRYRIRFS